MKFTKNYLPYLKLKFYIKNIYNWVYFKLVKSDYYFLHIPKTAGTYFLQLESTRVKSIGYLGHCLVQGEKKLDYIFGYPKLKIERKDLDGKIIAIARKPENWLKSYYGHATGSEQRYENKYHIDYGFKGRMDDMIVDIMQRSDSWPNKYGNIFLYCDSDGNFLPDILLYQESLDDGLSILAEKNIIPYSPREIQRKSNTKESFSNDSLTLIRDCWALDYDMLGYNEKSPSVRFFSEKEKKEISDKIKVYLKYKK